MLLVPETGDSGVVGMRVKQLVVTVSILVLIQLWYCNGCLEDERVALLQLQASFDIFWRPFEFDKTANCCDWVRIECDAHRWRATHLRLDFTRNWDWGYWYLNASLFLHFKQLTYLDLSSNRITGCCQNEGFKRLAELNKLRYLDLSDNNFDNNILRSLSGLSFLKSLNISYNKLKGAINLEELASLKNLEELRLSDNGITGFERLTELYKLKYLDLSNNNFNNDILLSLSGLLFLKSLDISYNLKGLIYLEELASLKNLEWLSLRGNGITGFERLIELKRLKYLDLSDNNFNNDILLPLSGLSFLKSLDISYNLKGLIYLEELASLKNLEGLCLGGNGITGFERLTELNKLKYLDLSNNNLTGGLPLWLSNFTSLQLLDLNDNSLVENLSSSPLTLMNSIQYLDLSDNNFHIPISFLPFYNCSNLSHLYISGNELYAETEWHNLIPKFQLEVLYMCYNGYGGSFPRFLYSQHNLQSVHLNDNKMIGEFPHWLLENNTRLEELYLSNNSFMGTIRLPTHSHVSNLFFLDMSHNELNGSFPPSIGNLSSVIVLDFNNNHLSGEIPSSLGSMEHLKFLDLLGNNISGNIPTFSEALSLTEVYMSKNILHGSFLHAFSDCSLLNTLDLSHNLLTEDLSRWYGSFPPLGFLLLGHNMLEGEIPSQLCSLPRLSFVDLSNNNLSGPILSCLMYYSNWYRGHGEYSHPPDYFIQGPTSAVAPAYAGVPRAQPQQPLEITTKNNSLSYKGMILTLYSGIDLSCNNLSGQIPPEFGNLNKIKTLNLSHNRLTGLIPATFSDLDQIESLDLSYNKLQGNIPPQLTQLPFVSSFSVAHNNLSGRTPERIKQFATFNNNSYEGNPFLCGEPLSRSCAPKSPSAMPRPTPSNEEESDFIDMGFFYVSFAVTYTIVLSGIAAILYINPYWRRAWFYFVERKMEDCYYFAVYDCPRFFKFKS